MNVSEVCGRPGNPKQAIKYKGDVAMNLSKDISTVPRNTETRPPQNTIIARAELSAGAHAINNCMMQDMFLASGLAIGGLQVGMDSTCWL